MIRVLRLIEYVYESAEMAEKDMGRWQLPAIGKANISKGSGMQIRSTILTDLDWESERDAEGEYSVVVSEDGNALWGWTQTGEPTPAQIQLERNSHPSRKLVITWKKVTK